MLLKDAARNSQTAIIPNVRWDTIRLVSSAVATLRKLSPSEPPTNRINTSTLWHSGEIICLLHSILDAFASWRAMLPVDTFAL